MVPAQIGTVKALPNPPQNAGNDALFLGRRRFKPDRPLHRPATRYRRTTLPRPAGQTCLYAEDTAEVFGIVYWGYADFVEQDQEAY